MGAPADEKARGLAKVINLSTYRKRDKAQRHGPLPARERELDERAHVYVDLDLDGQLAYGLKAVDCENALFLLEPTLYLVGQLLKLAMHHNT